MCAKGLLCIFRAQVHSRCPVMTLCWLPCLLFIAHLLRKGQSDVTFLNESQREAGCLFQEPTRSAPSLPGLVSRAWFSTQLEGLASQAEGGWRSWRGSPANSGNCPPSPLCLPFKAMKCHPWGRQDPNKAPAWLLGHGLWAEAGSERRRQSNPDGSLWPAPSREAAWPCSGS